MDSNIAMTVARLRRLYLFLAAALAVVLVGVALAAPALALALVAEDREVETGQAAFFFFAFVLGVVGLCRPRARGARLPYGLVPLLSLLAFLDEVSYGERIFGWRPTTLFGYEFDGVHDLFKIALCLWRDRGGPFSDWAVGSLLALGVIIAFLARRSYMPRLMRLARARPAFDYLRFAVIFIFIAQLMDVRVMEWRYDDLIEELLELEGALSLFFASGCMLLPAEDEQ